MSIASPTQISQEAGREQGSWVLASVSKLTGNCGNVIRTEIKAQGNG